MKRGQRGVESINCTTTVYRYKEVLTFIPVIFVIKTELFS